MCQSSAPEPENPKRRIAAEYKHELPERQELVKKKLHENRELLREFCRARGVDLDQPIEKVIRRVSLEEKNRQHEEWHRALEAFLAGK